MVVRTPAALTLPGGGTAGNVIAGAVETLVHDFDFQVFAGTSFGALLALFLAKGMTAKSASEIVTEMLQRDDLLDKDWNPFDNSPGLYKGEVIRRLIRKELGESTRLKDLKYPVRIFAVDLATSEPCMFDSIQHGDVLAWRVGAASSAIEFFFPPIRARGNNARTYGDGGLAINVPSGAWDDRPNLPTISVRFEHQHAELNLQQLMDAADGNRHEKKAKVVRTWVDLVPAAFNTAMNIASSSLPCRKPREKFGEVVLESEFASNGGGITFGLSIEQCMKNRVDGQRSAANASLYHLYR
jgi:predicted acylesterase/phospholipase RssA